MALPAKQKTWIISPCNRITYVSLNDTMARFLYGVKQHLKANGYTVKGSSDGAAGAMDGVDRWTGPVTGTIMRGATVTTAQSWIVLTDANGVNICFAYMGGFDYVARISMSSTGNYAAAATSATHTPTVSDGSEAVLCTTVDLINATASADRLWSCWVSSDAKSFRVGIARQNVWVGGFWGVETFVSVAYGPAVTVSPATLGWFFTAATLANQGLTAQGANIRGGYVRTIVSSVARVCSIAFGAECFGAASAFAQSQVGQDIAPELQGGVDFPIKPVSLYSITTGSRGKIGNLPDVWLGKTAGGEGNIYGNGEFIAVGTGGDIVWPWDGTPGVAGTTVAMA